jgi:hypothetical protein
LTELLWTAVPQMRVSSEEIEIHTRERGKVHVCP